MKKFIINSIYFLLILALIVQIRPLYLLYKDKYKETVTGSEIYYSIFKSKQKKKVKKILLGDSVGNQLFSNKHNNDTVNSMACNQSIGMVGQYLLLNNYLQAGNEIDTVYMLFSPFSFKNNLDQVYTYHYFLKPFYNDEYIPLFTETVTQQIHKVPYYQFCRIPLILTSNWAPEFESKDKHDFTFLSPVSIEYLQKIKDLSVKHGFKLILVPPPLSFSKKADIEKINKAEINKTTMVSEFENYFSNFNYIADSNFSDGTHLWKPDEYTASYRIKFIR